MSNTRLENGDFVVFNNDGLGILRGFSDADTWATTLHFWLSPDRQTCSVMCMENTPIKCSATEYQKKEILSAIDEAGYEWDEDKKEIHKKFKPLFNVGDKIVKKDSLSGLVHEISDVMDDYYILKRGNLLPFEKQSDYKIATKTVKNMFKPFDKVLYKRSSSTGRLYWRPAFFSCYDPYNGMPRIMEIVMGDGLTDDFSEDDIIPYEGNEDKAGQFV